MEHTMHSPLILLTGLLFQGCIYIGEVPKEGLLDTGAAPQDEAVSEIQFTATPSVIESREDTLVVLESDPGLDFSLVQDVYALGDAEVIAFRSRDKALHLMMNVLEHASTSSVHLVLDFGNEEMEVARDIIELTISDTPISPIEGEDTAGEEQEPVQ
jgi:hypothetical protein